VAGGGRLGFAILGAGSAAEFHRRAIEANADQGAKLVAIGHHNPSRFKQLEADFGVPCRGQDEILEHRDVDIVCICTPSGLHAAQTIAAARAGKHVLVEKPMALRLADADAMIAACKDSGVGLGVVFQRRSDPTFMRVRKAIEEGDLGELTLGVVTVPYHRAQEYYGETGWRGTRALDGGGVLMNQGIHLIDLLVWYMGDPIQASVHAATLGRDIEVEDTAVAALRFANGAMATVAATTTATPGFPHRIEVYGTRGGIQVEGESITRWEPTPVEDTRSPAPLDKEAAAAGAGGDPKGISIEGHIAIFRDFIGALRDERGPLVDGEEGRRSLDAVLEIYRAAGIYSAEQEKERG
jgi:predicted dehydrogenase